MNKRLQHSRSFIGSKSGSSKCPYRIDSLIPDDWDTICVYGPYPYSVKRGGCWYDLKFAKWIALLPTISLEFWHIIEKWHVIYYSHQMKIHLLKINKVENLLYKLIFWKLIFQVSGIGPQWINYVSFIHMACHKESRAL